MGNNNEEESIVNDLQKLVELVSHAHEHHKKIENDLSEAKEEAKHVPERRSKSRLR